MQRIMHPIMAGPLESKWGGGAPGILDTVPWYPDTAAVPDGALVQIAPIDGSTPFVAQRSGSDWVVAGSTVTAPFLPPDAVGVVDFQNDEYYWDGAARVKTDLTAFTLSGKTRHYLDSVDFGINTSQECTVMIEYTTPGTGGFASGDHAFSFTRMTGSGGRFEVGFTTSSTNTGNPILNFAQAQGGTAISGQPNGADIFNSATLARPLARGRCRAFFTYKKNAVSLMLRDGYQHRSTGNSGTGDYNINRVGFGMRVLNGVRDSLVQSDDLFNSMRFVIWDYAMTADQLLQAAIYSEQGLRPLVFYGDSFLERVGYEEAPRRGIVDHIRHEVRTQGYRAICQSNDGATAFYLDVPSGSGNNAITDKVAALNSLHHPSTLVFVDGGWDEDAATRQDGIEECLAVVGHDRWMDHETVYGTDKPIGHPNRVAYDTNVPLVQAFAGDHFIPTYTYMRAQGAPDATLSASIAAGHSANSITGRYCGISTTVGSFRTAVYISPAAEMTEMAPVQADGDWAILTQDDGANARGVYTVISGSWTFRYALPDMSGLSTADIHDSASDATGTWPHSQLYNAIHPSKQVGNTNYGDNTLDALTDMGYMSSKWL
jgi:hypothetical protein